MIQNLARHFKNLTKLSLKDNNIQSIEPNMIPQSVQTMEITHNNLSCTCEKTKSSEESGLLASKEIIVSLTKVLYYKIQVSHLSFKQKKTNSFSILPSRRSASST